ncbi:MAG: ATP-grasp domain-containing protein [Candidatus Saccharibacteria bacterium]|nr:ATP-grasp domain-containing protein [Candidatus Saccharibacteria bacterium]
MEKHKRVLTIVEGREANQKMMREVIEVGAERGWGVRLLKHISSIDIANNRLDGLFTEYVWWRGFGTNSGYESARVMEYVNRLKGVRTINTHIVGGLAGTSNKYYQHGVMAYEKDLAEHILPMYETQSKMRALQLVEKGAINYPFVVKPVFGTQGEGITLIRKEKDLDKVKDFTQTGIESYVQSKYDWRVFVLGGKALGVMRKTGGDDETDFELKSAGKTKRNEDDPEIYAEVTRLAELAAKTSGLDYTGVDLIRDDKTGIFYVVETNFAAGWQNGFKKATGVDVPLEVFKYFESFDK